MSGFHGAFATGVACQQGTLILPDTWFRLTFWDLLVLLLLRPDSPNLSCIHSTFHLEYPLVLSRFPLCTKYSIWKKIINATKKFREVEGSNLSRIETSWKWPKPWATRVIINCALISNIPSKQLSCLYCHIIKVCLHITLPSLLWRRIG